MSIIQDGSGQGNSAKVDGGLRLRTRSISESEEQHAAELGDAYNINSGTITGLASGASSLLYFYNDEDQDVVLEAVAVGNADATTSFDGISTVTLRRNDTAGDLITDQTAADQNQNRNFGSSKTLKSTTLAYKGKSGGTSTGGNAIAQFFMSGNSRLFASINFVIPRGSAVSVMINTNTTGTSSAYAALVLHTKDANAVD
jgi:hypothetical protein